MKISCFSENVLLFQQFHASGIDDILKLVNLMTDRYLCLSIYIATLGSWSNGFMHYPPFGLIKISDSHSFQNLVEMNGIEEATRLYEARSKIVRYFSGCSINIMILIQISIITQFSLESKLPTVRSKILVPLRNLVIFGDFQNDLRPKIEIFKIAQWNEGRASQQEKYKKITKLR